jgi:hypothetical protein
MRSRCEGYFDELDLSWKTCTSFFLSFTVLVMEIFQSKNITKVIARIHLEDIFPQELLRNIIAISANVFFIVLFNIIYSQTRYLVAPG